MTLLTVVEESIFESLVVVVRASSQCSEFLNQMLTVVFVSGLTKAKGI